MSQKRENLFGVKSSTVHKKEENRRRAAIGFKILVNKRTHSIVGKEALITSGIQIMLAGLSGKTRITSDRQPNQPRS